jgi:streptogramin lyase
MVISMSKMVKYVMVLSSVLLFLHTILGFYNTYDIFNDFYIHGKEFDRFSSPIESTEESIIRFIDMPLNITVLEEKNNRADEDISNSTELTSDTAFKQEEFRRGFCGINSTTSEFSEYVVEYTLPRDCEMPLGIAVDSEDNDVWYVSTKRGLLGKYDIGKDKFEQYSIPQWKVREEPRGFSQVWDVKIDNEDDDGSSDIWFTDTDQNAIWRFKKPTEQFEMYKIPAQSESFGTTYPITINVVTNKSDNEDINDKSIFFIGTFFPSLWFAEIDKLKNGTADGIHEIQLPTEHGFSNIDPLFVTSGSFAFDEDRNSVWVSMLSYSRKGQIFEYNLDNRSFNVFGLPDDLSSPLGIVVGDNDTDDNDREDSKNLWITNPGTSMFYNYEINERKIMKSDEDMQSNEAEDNKKTTYNASIERYTTSMASPRIFGRPFYDNNNNTNETEDDNDPRKKYYTLPSWIKKAKDGTIWFNQQQGNKIAHFDPAEQLLVEYWIPSQNKEWGTCDNEEKEDEKEKESINKNHNVTRGCGIANVLNFALKESDEKQEDEGEKNTVEEVWFTEWSANKIGRIDTEKDLPFNIDINEPDEALTIKRGESENIKLTLTTNEELIDHEDLQSEDATIKYKQTKSSKLLNPTGYDDDLITMTAAGTFTSTGYLGNSTGFFDVPILLLNQNKNNEHDDEGENEQEISFVFTPSKDMIPGDYTLMLGAENRSISVLRAVKINVI